MSAAGGESWLQICFVWLLRTTDTWWSTFGADCPAEVRGYIGRCSVTRQR
ncbi:hypothetical protein MBOL_29620 [Mycobacteroides abscessus subsp. bolletii BD]|nr:hypothetical protein A3N95_14685 [Mycobacteroides abscessus]EHM18918.1 hypothetical protein MBOL_29620 [Mycobacteroides abscessus subsp. bolletii BD]TPF70184.1 hypothetical protein XW60_00060 [Mycobacteroides abscessus subsp. bolletii]